ncbi:MAG: hypothetical protein KBT35_06365 [Firmicutes bacterium]|nr:hypothetical protein [Candidatus Colivicinus equi]
MSNSVKKIYVSLEMSDNEIKLLVGEYFNTRFNIIKTLKSKTMAFNGFKIADKELLVQDLKKVISEASSKLGAKIEKVILVLPSYNFKRFALRSTVVPSTGILKKEDVARAVANTLRSNVDYDVMMVNTVINKYTINGLATRRLPENETCSEALIDLDLLCCDKEMAYEYVDALESAGIKVLDICLNTYAVCKEASLIEESLKKNVILLDIGMQETFLTLLSKGKHLSTEVIFEGLNQMVDNVKNSYNIPYSDVVRMVKYAVNFNKEYQDNIIYSNNQTSITLKDVNDAVKDILANFVDKLLTMCKPIIDQGDTQIVIAGEGQGMKALVDSIKMNSGTEVKDYYPDTIGIRDSSFTDLFGSFVVYKEKEILNNTSISCIDLFEYDDVIDHKKIDVEGESITTKIKNLFIQYIN